MVLEKLNFSAVAGPCESVVKRCQKVLAWIQVIIKCTQPSHTTLRGAVSLFHSTPAPASSSYVGKE